MATTATESPQTGTVSAPKKDLLQSRWAALKEERSSWWGHWQEITTYLLPRSGRYFRGERNSGEKKHNAIYDNTGTRALRTLGAGMMAGATSPARPWFRLTTSDPDLAEMHDVRLWLENVTRRMQIVFQRSNTYRALHSGYEELGAFGTAAGIILPDLDNIIHIYACTVGEYAVATDYRGRVNALYREFVSTVQEVVGEFGLEHCSESVRRLYAAGNLDSAVTVYHAIEPRTSRDVTKEDAKNMPWGSYYWEESGDDFLRESGFRYFPAVVPRWNVAGNDVYGHSPGMEALGDIKQLQHEQLRKGQGIDYQTRPPLQVPTSMKNRDIDTLPGGISYIDEPQGKIQSAFDVRLDLGVLLEDIRDVRDRINGAFYADLFLLLANARDTRMTATEVVERHEEKLLMLGPVLERLHNELLKPLIDITFSRMLEAGLIPDAPPDLQGRDLDVEFVSMLAQAQRAMGINTADRFVAGVTAMAQLKPAVLDVLNEDEWMRIYSDMLGSDARLLRSEKEVAAIRQQQAEAIAAQQQKEEAVQAADAAAKLGRVPTGGPPNMATDIVNMFSNYQSPSAIEVATSGIA